MSKEIEINTFLNDLAKIYIQNPNLTITSDTIYHKLMNYDFSEEELKDRRIKNLFDEWIGYFKNKKNINVFNADWQPRFLQFSSNKYSSARCIKLYLSFPKDKIYECVNKVFEYIAKKNMPTRSKVSDILRSDSVVIRLERESDARKVIQFVNNDAELNNCSKKTNPFLLKQGNIGIGYDYMLSYNSVLSLLLEMYFKYCRLNNKLNEVSLETFREYVNNFHNNVFNNKQALEIFLKNEEVAEDLDRFYGDKVALIRNYDEVIGLIKQSLNPNMNIEEYFAFYKNTLREEKTKTKYNKFADILGQEKNNSYKKAVELLNEYIRYAELKYGGYNVTDYLERYMKGNNNAITRDNGYRQKFELYLPTDMIKFITNNNIKEYVNNHLTKKIKKQTPIEGYNLFLNACIETYKKYGANQVYNAIGSGLNGDYGYFTNGKVGYRDMMRQVNFSESINIYCQMIVKTYGNGILLTDNLYENCVNAIGNMVIGEYNNQIKGRPM